MLKAFTREHLATARVFDNVVTYFRDKLPEYEVMFVVNKSYHPDDYYLYMVCAKKNNGTYAFWTSWNEELQSLNLDNAYCNYETEKDAVDDMLEHYIEHPKSHRPTTERLDEIATKSLHHIFENCDYPEDIINELDITEEECEYFGLDISRLTEDD